MAGMGNDPYSTSRIQWKVGEAKSLTSATARSGMGLSNIGFNGLASRDGHLVGNVCITHRSMGGLCIYPP